MNHDGLVLPEVKRKPGGVDRKCPICGNGSVDFLCTQKFVLPDGYGLPSSYDIVSCKACGFVYADTVANQNDYDKYYEGLSKYESKTVGTGSGIDKNDKDRLVDFSKMISDHFKDRSVPILEVGCASGGLLNELRGSGYSNITGLDLSEACVNSVKLNGIEAIRGSVYSNKTEVDYINANKFGLIIMTGVLEHIYALDTALDFISDNLKENGHAFIRVPDAMRYSAYYKVPYYYFDLEHINHFSHNDINNLFGRHGFERIAHGEVDFFASDEFKYPDIYCIVRKNSCGGVIEVNYSDGTKTNILDFIERSRKDTYGADIIKTLYDNNEEVAVWGAGMNTFRLLASSLLDKCNITAFIDNDSKKQGMKLNGKPIVSPEFTENYKGTILLCSVFHNNKIEKQLRALGIRNRIIKL